MEINEISSELKGHFLRLYQIALSDEEFSPEEWKMLYQFAKERGVSHEELDKILLTHSGKVEIPESIEHRIEYLFDFARMILADGKITDDEQNALKKFCKTFEFLDENIDELTSYLLESAKAGKRKEEILNEIK